jgi:hypothetical protein
MEISLQLQIPATLPLKKNAFGRGWMDRNAGLETVKKLKKYSPAGNIILIIRSFI